MLPRVQEGHPALGLLEDIENQALDESVSLAAVLRRCLVLANRLGHDPFKAWVLSELNGYEREEDLPSYRKVRSSSSGFYTGFRGATATRAIDVSTMPEAWRDGLSSVNLYEGADGLEGMRGSDSLKRSWPEAAIQHHNTQLEYGWACHGVTLTLPSWKVNEAIGQIRTKILEFVISIRADYPEDDIPSYGPSPVPIQVVDDKWRATFIGGNYAISFGGDATSQVTTTNIVAGDLASLMMFLRAENVPIDELDELEGAITADPTGSELRAGRGKIRDWAERAAEKMAPATGKTIQATVQSVLTKAILTYLGVA